MTVGYGGQRRPIPRQQFIQPVDLVIVDAVEDVSEIGLRVETVQLGGFNDGHGTCEGFRTGIGPCKEPIFPSDSNRAQGALGGIVVDGHTTVGQKQAEGLLPAQAIAERLGQIAFAGNAQELLFGPGKEGLDLWLAQLLTRRMADVSGLTVDVALDVVELADPVERLAGDLGFGRGPKVVEVAPQMGPTGRLAQTRRAIGFRLVELGIALVAVRLQDAAGVGQMAENVLFLPVWREPIDSTRVVMPPPKDVDRAHRPRSGLV